MPRHPFRCSPDQQVICAGLDRLRTELEIPAGFPDDVMAEINNEECFRRMWSRVDVGVEAGGTETDLFAGINLEDN